MRSNKRKEFIDNLVQTNRAAGVEEQLIELLAAYAHLCFKFDKPVEFYGSIPDEKIKSRYPVVGRFIKNNEHLDPRGLEFLVKYAELLRKQQLPIIFTRQQLADYLSVSVAELEKMLQSAVDRYRTFNIPKASGGSRRICEPEPALKAVQTHLLKGMLENVRLHPAAMAFRRKRSISNNASPHTAKNIIIRLDLNNFFPSIPITRVQAAYENIGYPKSISNALARLTTYRGSLPMGAPTSPYLSNIIAARLDRRLEKLGLKVGFDYSRYADDLIFSSNNKALNNYIPVLKNIIEDEGFLLNPKKVKVMRSGSKQKVTGVVVNQKVNIDRHHYRKLRAVICNCGHGNINAQMNLWGASNVSSFKNQLMGHINFVSMLDIKKGSALLSSFKKIQWHA